MSNWKIAKLESEIDRLEKKLKTYRVEGPWSLRHRSRVGKQLLYRQARLLALKLGEI